MNKIMLLFADNVTLLSVGFAIIIFIYVLLTKWRLSEEVTLDELFVRVLAGSAVPTGILITMCSFNTSLITKLSDISIYLAFIGMALTYISIKEAFVEKKRKRSPSKMEQKARIKIPQ